MIGFPGMATVVAPLTLSNTSVLLSTAQRGPVAGGLMRRATGRSEMRLRSVSSAPPAAKLPRADFGASRNAEAPRVDSTTCDTTG